MSGPGRPPAPPIELTPDTIARLTEEARTLARDKSKLKNWLAPKRIFHILLQDHLSTMAIPGGKGVVQNAASSKLFLEMTEPLAAALEEVESEEEEEDMSGAGDSPRRTENRKRVRGEAAPTPQADSKSPLQRRGRH